MKRVFNQSLALTNIQSAFWTYPGLVSSSDGYQSGGTAIWWSFILSEYFYRGSRGVEIQVNPDAHTFEISVVMSKMGASPMSSLWSTGASQTIYA